MRERASTGRSRVTRGRALGVAALATLAALGAGMGLAAAAPQAPAAGVTTGEPRPPVKVPDGVDVKDWIAFCLYIHTEGGRTDWGGVADCLEFE